MLLTPMQYKRFVWPHNPRSYSIRYERQVAVHKVPFGRYAMQDVGLRYQFRTVTWSVLEQSYPTWAALEAGVSRWDQLG